jgi:hypothetical protein
MSSQCPDQTEASASHTVVIVKITGFCMTCFPDFRVDHITGVIIAANRTIVL